MDGSGLAQHLDLIRRFCAASGAVLFNDAIDQLLDVYSAKALTLDAKNLVAVEERTDRQTDRPYLLLSYEDGRQLALTDAGIAFAPDARNSGPVPELPSAVCFRDFGTLLDRFKHQAYGHRQEKPTKEAARLLLLGIAILDGARAVGFDIGREEKELDFHLSQLEK